MFHNFQPDWFLLIELDWKYSTKIRELKDIIMSVYKIECVNCLCELMLLINCLTLNVCVKWIWSLTNFATTIMLIQTLVSSNWECNKFTQSAKICNFYAEIVKFGLILTHLEIILGRKMGGKKIFWGGANTPCPSVVLLLIPNDSFVLMLGSFLRPEDKAVLTVSSFLPRPDECIQVHTVPISCLRIEDSPLTFSSQFSYEP